MKNAKKTVKLILNLGFVTASDGYNEPEELGVNINPDLFGT